MFSHNEGSDQVFRLNPILERMNIYQETTPLKPQDIFVVLDSYNNGFDYPIHNHPEFELNLIIGISGSRIVGDSIERYMDADLVLLGPYLYHKWDGDDESKPYRVITIQFGIGLISGQFFQKEQFTNIRKLLENASEGIKFSGKTQAEAIPLMQALTEDKGFINVILFLRLLDLLAHATETRYLSNAGFATKVLSTHSDRLHIAYSYILKNFERSDLKLSDIASLINMSNSGFSHFFNKYSLKSYTAFLIDIRIGHACKNLLDTDETIGQICFKSGFNNLANFNRLFKKHRQCTPAKFRKKYLINTAFDWTQQVTPMQFTLSKGQTLSSEKPKSYATRLVHV